MSFTKEQQAAIEYRGSKSAAVSASAGSGKTTVLIEHIAHLISDRSNPVKADRLAAVTFTEKAAAELKERLEKRIDTLLEANPDDEFLRDQAVRLSSAYISTISSFCLSLIKDNMRLLPLEEGVEVIDEAKKEKLSKTAIKKMLESFYTQYSPSDQSKVMNRLGGENEIKNSVLQLHKFLSNIPDAKGWTDRQTKLYSSSADYEREYVKPIVNDLLLSLLDMEKELEQAVKSAEDYILQDELFNDSKKKLTPEEKLSDRANNVKNYFSVFSDIIGGIVSSLQSGKYKDIAVLAAKETGKSPTLKNTEFDSLIALKENAKKAIDDIWKKGGTLSNWDSDRQECLAAFKYLVELEKIYSREFARIKKEFKAVDFSDLEHYALEAAKKGAWKNKFDYIIVDEFQDSNDIQYEIFKLISKDEKNLFLVGDEKQCIYAFRNANPEIFASLCQNPDYENIKLNSNFRSNKCVIDTVNDLFSTDDKPASFSGNPWEDMKAERDIPYDDNNKSQFVKVYVKPVEKKPENDDDSDGKDLEEYRYVVNRIKEMVGKGFTVHEGEAARPCNYGDFAVLTRKNSTVLEIRKLLEEAEIPSVSLGEKDFTNLIEVEIAMSVYSAIVRPNDDIAVAKALMSPVYCFTAQDMAMVRLAKGTDVVNPKITSLYFNLSKMDSTYNADNTDSVISADSSDEKDRLHVKIRKFMSDMKLLRKEAAKSTAAQLMRKMYQVTLVDQIMSVGLKGKERLANLRLLVHYAKNYSYAGQFIDAIKEYRRSSFEMPQAQEKGLEESSVKVMSIHASKGLQFPIVFVVKTNAKPNTSDTSSRFIFNGKKGVGMTLFDYGKFTKYATASRRCLESEVTDGMQGEELRLLYVAFTRAEEKLIVTSTVYLKLDAKKSEYEEAAPVPLSYYEFITKGLERNPDVFNTIEVNGEEIPAVKALDQKTNSADNNFSIDLDFDKLKENLQYKYPYEKATLTPAKFSATALGVNAEKGEDDSSISRAFYLGLPLFIKKDNPLTPKERGDLYHKVMENLDFNEKNGEKELERLEREGVISSKERGEIKPEEIQQFIDSPLADRARKSSELKREFPIFTVFDAIKANTQQTDLNSENENTEQYGDYQIDFNKNSKTADLQDLSFIQGIADMFFVENGEIVLVDYKTNRNTTASKLVKEYKGQFAIYKKALEEMLSMKVKECWLYSFSLGMCIKVEA